VSVRRSEEVFTRITGRSSAATVRSPGRVNLIGDHTDYNDGLALAMATHLGTDVTVGPRVDDVLRVVALRVDDTDERRVGSLEPSSGPRWSRYVAGCAAKLLVAGVPLGGADVVIDGDLPLGAGLSSSASLELGVLVALSELGGTAWRPTDLVVAAQQVEHEVVGVRSGLMDQLTVALAEVGSGLLLDFRTTNATPVPMPDGWVVLVFDSALSRDIADTPYNRRRDECEFAQAALAEVADIQTLRDVDLTVHAQAVSRLSEVERRRVRHVVTENQRVIAGAAAMRAGDAAEFGRLMSASHSSLRDDFEVSCPELDLLVELATAEAGVVGARMTGAGFGGCVVALADGASAQGVGDRVAHSYRSRTGLAGTAVVCRPAGGVAVVSRERAG
jgi:galactokinase